MKIWREVGRRAEMGQRLCKDGLQEGGEVTSEKMWDRGRSPERSREVISKLK